MDDLDVSHIISKKFLKELEKISPISSLSNLFLHSNKTNRGAQEKDMYQFQKPEYKLDDFFKKIVFYPDENFITDVIHQSNIDLKRKNFNKIIEDRYLNLVDNFCELIEKHIYCQ